VRILIIVWNVYSQYAVAGVLPIDNSNISGPILGDLPIEKLPVKRDDSLAFADAATKTEKVHDITTTFVPTLATRAVGALEGGRVFSLIPEALSNLEGGAINIAQDLPTFTVVL
jgi:hypothetical protein